MKTVRRRLRRKGSAQKAVAFVTRGCQASAAAGAPPAASASAASSKRRPVRPDPCADTVMTSQHLPFDRRARRPSPRPRRAWLAAGLIAGGLLAGGTLALVMTGTVLHRPDSSGTPGAPRQATPQPLADAPAPETLSRDVTGAEGVGPNVTSAPVPDAGAAHPATAPADAAAASDRPPRPSGDFTLRGRTVPDGGEVRIAHHDGKVKIEVAPPAMPVSFTGYLDLATKRLQVLSVLPAVGRVAMEMPLPPEYVVVDMPPGSARAGRLAIAGESCEVWRGTDKALPAPVEVCVTDDGVPLRSLSYTESGQKVMFEATGISRAPLAPDAVLLPKGVKVNRLPSALQNMMPGRP